MFYKFVVVLTPIFLGGFGLTLLLLNILVREMEKRFRVRDYDKQIKKRLEGLEKSDISEKNKTTIKKYFMSRKAEGISSGHCLHYIIKLSLFCEWLGKDMELATKEDIDRVLWKLEERYDNKNTKALFKAIIKRFYKWLLGDDEEYPPCVKRVKINQALESNVKRRDLLTREELRALIQASAHPKDKAYIAVLYETAARIEEFLTLRIEDIVPQRRGVLVQIRESKTKLRPIRILASVPYLMNWIDSHPYKEDPHALLWLNVSTRYHGRPIGYVTAREHLRALVAKAGIERRIHHHLFRHTRISELMNHLNDAHVCKIAGWKPGSRMLRIYGHLAEKDVRNSIYKMYGIKISEEEKKDSEPLLSIVYCSQCNAQNGSASNFCLKCGAPIDNRTAVKVQDDPKDISSKILDVLTKKPDMKERIAEILAGDETIRQQILSYQKPITAHEA